MQNGRALGGARKAESGETLVESLITIAIIGLVVVAILGAIWTTLRVSDYHSKASNADTVVRGYAEAMKDPASTSTYHYVPCTTAGGQVTYPAYVPTAPYTNYVASITKIRYLTSYNAGTPVWSNTCPAADAGMQEITLTVTSPTNDPAVRGRETVVIVKRDARADIPVGSA
jgi:type II secretory pathway pseudopilin PulG